MSLSDSHVCHQRNNSKFVKRPRNCRAGTSLSLCSVGGLIPTPEQVDKAGPGAESSPDFRNGTVSILGRIPSWEETLCGLVVNSEDFAPSGPKFEF